MGCGSGRQEIIENPKPIKDNGQDQKEKKSPRVAQRSKQQILKNDEKIKSARKQNTNNKNQQQQQQQKQDLNKYKTFPDSGIINIKIIRLKKYLEKNTNNSKLDFLKQSGNISWLKKNNKWNFKLKYQPKLEINFEINFQGELLIGNNNLWKIINPFKLYNDRCYIGQLILQNNYIDHISGDDGQTPYLENIKNDINGSLFQKWGQEIPQEQKNTKIELKSDFYTEVCRFFELYNGQWMGGFYINKEQNLFTQQFIYKVGCINTEIIIKNSLYHMQQLQSYQNYKQQHRIKKKIK